MKHGQHTMSQKLVSDTITIIAQVNGNYVLVLMCLLTFQKMICLEVAMAHENVQTSFAGKEIVKTIAGSRKN